MSMKGLAKVASCILIKVSLAGCSTLATTEPDLKPIILEAVCKNLVPVAGSKADTELTRRQVRRQNARVDTCPLELRRKADLT